MVVLVKIDPPPGDVGSEELFGLMTEEAAVLIPDLVVAVVLMFNGVTLMGRAVWDCGTTSSS
jgi:hypothetical protein